MSDKPDPTPKKKPLGQFLGTFNPPFEAVKHLLSNKPLRRPNRTKPHTPGDST